MESAASLFDVTNALDSDDPFIGTRKAIMDKALAAELERTRQELKPDPEGFQRGLRRFQRRTRRLARRLLEPMRRGLTEEARLVYSQGWTERVFGRVVDMLFSRDSDLGTPEPVAPERMEAEAPGPVPLESLPSVLVPGDEEVETAAIELAQLLLSNWTGFIRFASAGGRHDALVALRETPPRLPPEVTTGCTAYPVTTEECGAILVSFLVEEERLIADEDAAGH